MTTPVPGHSAPSVGFEVPLEMLMACHERIRSQCETLRRLHDHLIRHGADAPAREAAEAVMRYFRTAARLHHEDEETDLFPALLESMAGSEASCIRDMHRRTEHEHRGVEGLWASLDERLEGIAAGRSASLDLAGVDAFVDAYEHHMAFEEREVFPMAERLLSDQQLDALGAAMRQRRGIELHDI